MTKMSLSKAIIFVLCCNKDRWLTIDNIIRILLDLDYYYNILTLYPTRQRVSAALAVLKNAKIVKEKNGLYRLNTRKKRVLRCNCDLIRLQPIKQTLNT